MTISKEMEPHFRIAGWLAVVLVIFDTWLSVKFGWSVSLEMAGVYGAISLASGTFLVIALWFMMQGFKKFGAALAVAWCFAFTFNIWSNMGVATANRMADVQSAAVQQAKYITAQDGLSDTRANVALWTKLLTDLQAQAPWAPTVKADALRKDITTLEGRLKDETEGKRGRKAGCGKVCEDLQNQLKEANAKKAAAERFDDLTQKIEAAKAVLAANREKATSTDKGISNAANQSALYAKIVNRLAGGSFSADPTQEQVATANEGTGIATAFVLALLAAATCLVSAMPALFGVQATSPSHQQTHDIYSAPASPSQRTALTPSHSTREIVRTDATVWRGLRDALRTT
jgi:uncharacterized membrane protein YbaN (DUF454 family)